MTLCFHVLHISLKLFQALKSENADIRQRTQNLQKIEKIKYNIKHNYYYYCCSYYYYYCCSCCSCCYYLCYWIVEVFLECFNKTQIKNKLIAALFLCCLRKIFHQPNNVAEPVVDAPLAESFSEHLVPGGWVGDGGRSRGRPLTGYRRLTADLVLRDDPAHAAVH